MPQKCETPRKGGASRDSFAGRSRDSDSPFTSVQQAARALLGVECLSEREGQFIGGLAYRGSPISDKQANWLHILLGRHGLPPLAREGSQ